MRAGSSISVVHLVMRAEHRAVIDLLERLALAHLTRDLSDEHDQRRGILLRDMDARRGIGGAGPAGDEADAGPAGRLAVRLRHHRGAAFLAADGDLDLAVVEGVERGEIALARHAEHMRHAMRDQLIDEDFAAGPRSVIGAHQWSPSARQGFAIGANLTGSISLVTWFSR